MTGPVRHGIPVALTSIRNAARFLAVRDVCDDSKGRLLAVLAASAGENARILEIGGGVGASTTWLLAGMRQGASLTTIDLDLTVQSVALRHLEDDRRVRFHHGAAGPWVTAHMGQRFDLVVVECELTSNVLAALVPMVRFGGVYVVRSSNWPLGIGRRPPEYLVSLRDHPDESFRTAAWQNGLLLGQRVEVWEMVA